MGKHTQNLYDLLSGFYTLLWAQLDSLFDEHRWTRVPLKEGAETRTPEDILGGLSELEGKALKLPMPIKQLKDEVALTKMLVAKWKGLQGEWKWKPTKELSKQVNDLRREIQDKRALFEERALAFASLIAS